MTATATRTGPLADKTVTDLLVTTEAVIRDLDRWEYVYPGVGGCVYRDQRGAPSCLIGHVLYRWGVLDQAIEGMATSTFQPLGASRVLGNVARAIQKSQDRGETWGEALSIGYATRERVAI